MEYTDVKEWLDNLVRIYREANEQHYLNNSIKASLVAGEVLIYKGIHVLADIAGIELFEEILPNDYYNRYRYFFEYEGVIFSSYEEKRLESFAGTDREQNTD